MQATMRGAACFPKFRAQQSDDVAIRFQIASLFGK